MTKTLIITAHPSSKGFTHVMAKSLAKKYSDSEILDLYASENQQDFLNYEDVYDIPQDEKRNKFQKKITQAGRLVFCFPIWWGTFPAILKNFIDMNFTSGFAFKFHKGQTIPEKLLTGKTAEVYMTCDAPSIFYWILGNPYKKLIKNLTLEFCGIKVTKVKLLDKFHKTTEDQRVNFLKKIGKI